MKSLKKLLPIVLCLLFLGVTAFNRHYYKIELDKLAKEAVALYSSELEKVVESEYNFSGHIRSITIWVDKVYNPDEMNLIYAKEKLNSCKLFSKYTLKENQVINLYIRSANTMEHYANWSFNRNTSCNK